MIGPYAHLIVTWSFAAVQIRRCMFEAGAPTRKASRAQAAEIQRWFRLRQACAEALEAPLCFRPLPRPRP